jgi:flagellar hook-basal body complex protein FliE
MATSSIGSIGSLLPSGQPSPTTTAAAADGQPFGDALSRLVNKVEQTGAAANDAVSRMLDGSGDVHDAMIALQQSDTTFQLAVQVRNKLVQAYQDIMRMPV